MTTTIHVAGKQFHLTSAKAGVYSFPYSDDKNPHQRYQIRVTTEYNGSFKFMYYTSTHDYETGKAMDADDLKTAFYIYLGDLLIGSGDYQDFLSEFGFKNETHAKRIYNACRKGYVTWMNNELGRVEDYINDFQLRYPEHI